MKNNSTYKLCALFAFILMLPCLFGCDSSMTPEASTADPFYEYSNRLLELEDKLLDMRDDQFASELEYLEEIRALQAEIDALRKYIYTSSTQPPESSTDPTESFLEYTYKIENGEATITKYTGKGGAVVVPGSIENCPVTAIGEGAFRTSKVSSVTLPDTVKLIDWFAFADCTSLSRIVIPAGVNEIGYEAFSGCKSLTIYTSSGSYAEKYAKSYGIALSVE